MWKIEKKSLNKKLIGDQKLRFGCAMFEMPVLHKRMIPQNPLRPNRTQENDPLYYLKKFNSLGNNEGLSEVTI